MLLKKVDCHTFLHSTSIDADIYACFTTFIWWTDYDMVEYGIGTCFFSDSGIHTNKILRKGRFAIWNTENLTIR